MNNYEDFDDFEQQEFAKIDHLRKTSTLTAINKFIEDNIDHRTKEIGDNVLVWDCSRLTDNESNKIEYQDNVHTLLSNYPSIVIETGCKYTAEVKTLTGDFSKNLDLKIWNKNLNKVYRTSSEFVKIV